MKNKNKVKKFLRESNAIERVYDDDSLQQAIYAWSYLVRQKEMTTGVMLKTHKILMLNQELLPNEKGYFRREQVWIGGREGKDWHKIPALMKHWCLNVNDLLINGKNEHKIFLKRMIKEHHVKYEKIHPFIDGNGRTGRMFMNWQRVKLGLPILVIKEAEKDKYYKWFDTTEKKNGK